MNKLIIHGFPFAIALLFFNVLFSQNTLKGKVLDNNNNPIHSVIITVKGVQNNTITNGNGAFVLENLPNVVQLKISRLGYKTLVKNIETTHNKVYDFVLTELYENLNTVVVTGTFDARKQLESSTSVSVLTTENLKKLVPRGTADLLRNTPGTFVDASAGEVFTKVYSRGISASAEDDMGWYYTSLQEDGLPVSLIQHSYYSPDLFYRNDISTQRVEAIRGGSAAITAMNAPGGIYNFISSNKTEPFGGQAQVTAGIQGENNFYSKYEFMLNDALGNDWFYNIGGHYRKDEGARNTDFTFSNGGQVKVNFIKKNDKGYFKLYTKVLHDKTNRWNGVTATNWENPTAVYGQDFNTTSQLFPSINATIPDGRDLENQKTISFDPSQGVLAKDVVLGFDFSQTLNNDWTIENNIKLSNKSANWQTTISNAFVGLGDYITYFVLGYSPSNFPSGNLVFRDANTNAVLAEVDNSNAVNFSGGFNYNNGSLPNDAILGSAGWYKNTNSKEVMDHLVFHKKWGNHNVNTGVDFGYATTKHYTQSSFVFATYENNPKTMVVTLENPESPAIALSDENGVSNYGGLFFENTSANLYQTAVFVNDLWDVTDQLQLDAGIRYENIVHEGSKNRSEPFSQAGGYDGDELTDYDNGISQPNGIKDRFDYNYNYVSYSVGINYKIQDDLVLFGRSSKGHKAPELNYYFNNFTNVPVPKKGEVQDIYQSEIGLKYNQQNMYVSGTAFLSELSNIGTTDFNFDEDTNTISYTPTQFNNSKTVGFELESMYKPVDFLRFNLNGVLQNAKSKNWTVYDSEQEDNPIISYNNKKLPHNPNLMFNFKTTYEQKDFYAFVDAKYMGERQGNIANGFTLPSYVTVDLGAGYAFNSVLNLSANITNVLNSNGLAGFYGPNTFGGNSNQATPEFIADNPYQNFIVVPILPRGMFLKLNYQF